MCLQIPFHCQWTGLVDVTVYVLLVIHTCVCNLPEPDRVHVLREATGEPGRQHGGGERGALLERVCAARVVSPRRRRLPDRRALTR